MKKYITIVFLICALASPIFSNESYGTGLQPLPSGLEQSMAQAQPKGILSQPGSSPGNGSESARLPSKVDLSEFLPPVKNQGFVNSCSAWSTVYYAKTIQENQERGWGADSLDHQFSPLFTYNQITKGVDEGTAIVEHMILLETQGAPTLSHFPYMLNISILPDENVIAQAANYKSSYHKVLEQYDYENNTVTTDLNTVKIVLAEGSPVVTGFQIYSNLDDYSGGVYDRTSGASKGGHAMCVVGYDDDKAALKIVNSWGNDWGEEGFLWLAYDLFEELAVYGCAVMYDVIDTVPDFIQSPMKIISTKGAFTNKIDLNWDRISDADYYIVYRVNNAEGTLKEVGRTVDNHYSDNSLPSGISYIYAVKSVKDNGEIISDFSEIAEGWTLKQNSVPGIPTSLKYSFFNKNPLLIWDPLDNVMAYNIYRWSTNKEEYLWIGSSSDSSYLDRTYINMDDEEIAYYIDDAYNEYGFGFATDSLAIVKGSNGKAPGNGITQLSDAYFYDDRAVATSQQTSFKGDYYRTDYFDFEYTQAKFREYYEKEMEAFRNFQLDEQSRFEEWKNNN